MPSARDALLDAAFAALAHRPWPRVLGTKTGLAGALVHREADGYLRGVDRALALRAPPDARLMALAEWTVGQARVNPLVRALITGFWDAWLPAPPLGPGRSDVPEGPVPGPPSPAELVDEIRDRAVAALGEELTPSADGSATACEIVVRLALACAVAPAATAEVARLVRGVLLRPGPGR